MALTDPERLVVAFIFKQELEPLGAFAIANFFDQPKATQMAQLKVRVQAIRDTLQTHIDTHVADSAARLVKLNNEAAVLDGLLAKL